jgi:DNA-binding transcriptional ArsR family regulator
MDNKTIQGLLNPVRMQIIVQFLRRKRMTTRELAGFMPDIPQASLYRHMKRLLEDGVLEVAETLQIRGTVEKIFELVVNPYDILEKEVDMGNPDDLISLFYQFIMIRMVDFSRYISAEKADMPADLAGFRSMPLHLSEGDTRAFIADFSALLSRYMELSNLPGKKTGDADPARLRTFSFIFHPSGDDS